MLRIDEVKSRTGLRRTAIYELEARGEFPARIHLTLRAVAWVERDIERWLLDRINARSVQPRSQSQLAAAAKRTLAECGCQINVAGGRSRR